MLIPTTSNSTYVIISVPSFILCIKLFIVQAEFYGRDVIVADREMVEQGADEFLQRSLTYVCIYGLRMRAPCMYELNQIYDSRMMMPYESRCVHLLACYCPLLLYHYICSEDIALLVVGDPFGATTHTDLCTRCKHMGVCIALHI
jgi:hypothetical protein